MWRRYCADLPGGCLGAVRCWTRFAVSRSAGRRASRCVWLDVEVLLEDLERRRRRGLPPCRRSRERRDGDLGRLVGRYPHHQDWSPRPGSREARRTSLRCPSCRRYRLGASEDRLRGAVARMGGVVERALDDTQRVRVDVEVARRLRRVRPQDDGRLALVPRLLDALDEVRLDQLAAVRDHRVSARICSGLTSRSPWPKAS